MSQRLIVVIGMHRSGTSAVTKALSYIGVHLGDDFIDLMPEVNAKGFWEDASLNRLNISILTRLKSDWLTNQSLNYNLLHGSNFRELVALAKEILLNRLEDCPQFAFKDPRTTILLPFWKTVISEVGCESSYVIAFRHPLEVAGSLRQRNGFEFVKSLILWLRYNYLAVTDTEGCSRVFVDFIDLLQSPEEQLKRLANELLLAAPTGSALAEFSEQFISTDLRRNIAGDIDLNDIEAGKYPVTLAMEFYDALKQLCGGPTASSYNGLALIVSKVGDYLNSVESLLQYLDTLEYATAKGSACLKNDEFPWINTFRSSFNVADEVTNIQIDCVHSPEIGNVGIDKRAEIAGGDNVPQDNCALSATAEGGTISTLLSSARGFVRRFSSRTMPRMGSKR